VNKKQEDMIVFYGSQWCQAVLLRTCMDGSGDGALNGELSNPFKELGDPLILHRCDDVVM
jgi:hypothetical protein